MPYPGSMVVTDPKGENYEITRRRRASFGKVRMLNPTELEHSDRYNPIDIIRIGTPNEADDAAALASLMIKPDAREAHWDDKAASMLKALILHTLQEPDESRTLAAVRRLSVGTPQVFLATLETIADESPSLAAREIAAGFLTSACAQAVGPDRAITQGTGTRRHGGQPPLRARSDPRQRGRTLDTADAFRRPIGFAGTRSMAPLSQQYRARFSAAVTPKFTPTTATRERSEWSGRPIASGRNRAHTPTVPAAWLSR